MFTSHQQKLHKVKNSARKAQIKKKK